MSYYLLHLTAIASSILDGIFRNYQTKLEAAVMRKTKARAVEEPADIQMAKQRSEPKISENFAKAVHASKQTSRPRLIDEMELDEERSHREMDGHANRPHTRSRHSGDLEGARRQPRVAEVDTQSFYGSGNVHETRSSRRKSERELAPQSPPRPRTLSPERWTEINPQWKKQWRNSIIYPKEGKNKATVDKEDIQRLDEGEFLNDNLIMFYLLHLERELATRNPELSKRIYFHDTLFYTRLSKSVKGKKGINYEAVERWTAKVDLFSYDYIIVPVNELTHWYVAIICNAPKLVNPGPEVIKGLESQELSPDAKISRLDADALSKSPSATSPQSRPNSPSETGVGKSMAEMSLQGPIDDIEELRDDELDPKPSSETLIQNGLHGQPDIFEKSPKPEPRAVDIEEAPKQASTAKKGKRKSSGPPPKKYDPKDPRIITFDSFGHAHSPTCANLRDYLRAEMKSKRGLELPVPQQLGMTATNIPQQKNYCDCGLFLLSYIEQFLKCPDEFIEDIFQRTNIDVVYDLTKAPDMRVRIRELLFDLQALQIAEGNEKAEAKRQAKKDPKAQGKVDAAVSTKSNSREASNSARASVNPEDTTLNRTSAQPEPPERGFPHEQTDPSPHPAPATRKPTSDLPTQPRWQERDTKTPIPESRTESNVPTAAYRVSNEPINLDDESQHGPSMHTSSGIGSGIASLLSHISKPFSKLGDTAGSSNKIRLGRSHSDAFVLEDDSPQKPCIEAPPTPGGESPSTQLHAEKIAEERTYENPSSPSLDAEEQVKPSGSRHRSGTPYPRRESTSTPLNADEIPESPTEKDSAIIDSPPLQPAAKPITLSNYVDMTGDDDQEMLLPQMEQPQQAQLSHEPNLLSSSPPSTPVSATSQKKRTSQHSQRESNHTASPQKSPRSNQSTNARQRTSGIIEGRDPLESEMMKQWKGKHRRSP